MVCVSWGGGVFSWHTLGPLLPAELAPDHVHHFITAKYFSSDGYFQQDDEPCYVFKNNP